MKLKNKRMKKKRYSIKYRRTRIYFDENQHTGICIIRGPSKKTDFHHWLFEFPTKQVKKNPQLALKNTVEVSFQIHDLANTLRKLAEADLQDILILIDTMDPSTRTTFNQQITRLYDHNQKEE